MKEEFFGFSVALYDLKKTYQVYSDNEFFLLVCSNHIQREKRLFTQTMFSKQVFIRIFIYFQLPRIQFIQFYQDSVMFSCNSTMTESKEEWIDLVTQMLWIIEREIKFTLRGISNEFKQSGLSFDQNFRSHFFQIIMKRLENSYQIIYCY